MGVAITNYKRIFGQFGYHLPSGSVIPNGGGCRGNDGLPPGVGGQLPGNLVQVCTGI